MCIFCLLTSIELTLLPDCNLFYLHSNDMNILKSLFQKNCVIYKYNCYKNTLIKSAC